MESGKYRITEINISDIRQVEAETKNDQVINFEQIFIDSKIRK